MSDGAKAVFTPVHRSGTGPPVPDLRAQYSDLSAAIRTGPLDPQKMSLLSELLGLILAPYAQDHGELVLNVNGSKSRFEIEGRPFTNFAAVLLSVIRNQFVDHTQHILELLIWGQHLPPKIIRVDSKRLGSGAWLDDLGPQYIYEHGLKHIQILLQAMSQYAPVKDEYHYSGWIADGSSNYIMNGKKIKGDGWNTTNAQISCVHTLNMLDIAGHSLTIPLLSIALLSLVQSQMMVQGEYFKGVCCIAAPTQSFKTTLASLFFNFENGREANTNFEATMAAIVRTIGNTRDSTSIVDDFKPGATKAEHNDMIRKLSTIIRMCSDDSGGVQKAGKQNSISSNASHGLVVVTAEHVQLSVQSTLARLLILEMNRNSVDVEKLSDFQKNHGTYQDFIKNFIRYVASLGVKKYCERLVQCFLQERNTLRNELLAKDIPIDNRASDMVTWLWLSFGEFLDYT